MPETYISRSLTPYLKQFRRDPPLTCKTPAAPSRNGTSLIRFASRSRRAPQRPRMIKLGMLGTVSLSDADGREVRSVLRQPRRLALLAYLAAATPALTSFPFPYRRPSGASRPEQSLPCS